MQQKEAGLGAQSSVTDLHLEAGQAPAFGPAHKIFDSDNLYKSSFASGEEIYDVWHGSLDGDGNPHGWGKYVFSERTGKGITYIGNCNHGRFDGKGLIIHHSGLKFEGDFRAGVAWNGQIITPAGQKVEVGRLRSNDPLRFTQIQWCTPTELKFPDGVLYVGSQDNGLPHGAGRLLFPNKDSYEGQFQWGKKWGRGIYTFGDGRRRYEGEFADGTYNGDGKFEWRSGPSYEGTWKNGLLQGQGLFIFPNGLQYRGEYDRGIPHGRGIETFQGKTVRSGLWEQGHLTKSDQIGDIIKAAFQPVIEIFSSWYPPFSKEGRESVAYKWERIHATPPQLTIFEVLPQGFYIPDSPEIVRQRKLAEFEAYRRRSEAGGCPSC